jgi:hypothetical protein
MTRSRIDPVIVSEHENDKEGSVDEMLYIVFGEDGEYSDWCQWPVAAYRDKALARRHVECAEIAARLKRELKTDAAKAILDAWDGSDDAFRAYAPSYSLQEVKLRDALPDAPLEQMQEGLRRGKGS